VFDVAAAAPELAPFADGFRLMFAGNIGEAQDFPTILAAAALLKERADIHWLIVGDGRAAPDVRAEIARLGLERQVHLLGRFALERMPAFFAGADALLVSLKPEPIFALTVPGKVQSYLAAGRPIVAMLDGEGARVVRESDAGLSCAAGDAQGLADCVAAMAGTDPAARERMGRNGRAYAREMFDRDRLVSRLEDWLADACAAARPRT
jgi:colanic acid biosynthesis glycosyl transferase WcaI